MSFVQRPQGPCPKCGDGGAFADISPRYVPSRDLYALTNSKVGYMRPDRSEHLEWACRTCGYTVETPTLDAVEEAVHA